MIVALKISLNSFIHSLIRKLTQYIHPLLMLLEKRKPQYIEGVSLIEIVRKKKVQI